MLRKRTVYWLLTALLVLLMSGCGPCMMWQKNCGDGCRMRSGHQGAPCAAAPAAESARKDVLYSCNCGPECHCNSVSVAPGNCACGKPLAWGHLVRVEGDEALLCTCKEGCQCKIDPNDSTKCGCGNPIKRISMKGSGLYFCNCGGSCACNTLSAQPAECRCGMPLKTVN
ncbi:MAG: hypothetical protein NDI73_01190 [Desulfuromonadales bacterium]|nr:hypothetical protein [Desulfuromonadales bacterium]